MQIGSMLPENPADARVVIEHMKELLDTFLDKPASVKGRKFGVVQGERKN